MGGLLSVLCVFNMGQQNMEWTGSGIETLQGNSSGSITQDPGRDDVCRRARIVIRDGI